MEHLSFEIICRIADGDLKQNEIIEYLNHYKLCKHCHREIELQQSILELSRKMELINPSDNFERNILSAIIPTKKKILYEWILRNLGNIFAMALILAFLGYVFSVAQIGSFQNGTQVQIKHYPEFIKIINDGSNQISTYFTARLLVQAATSSQIRIIVYSLFAIILLVFIDQIAGHFFLNRMYKS